MVSDRAALEGGCIEEEEESEDADQEWELALGADAVAVEDYSDWIESSCCSSRRGEEAVKMDELVPNIHVIERGEIALRVGDLIDAQDRDGKWYDSVVVARGPASDLLGAALEEKDISVDVASPAQSSMVGSNGSPCSGELEYRDAKKLELLLSNEKGRNGAEADAVRVHFKGWSS